MIVHPTRAQALALFTDPPPKGKTLRDSHLGLDIVGNGVQTLSRTDPA